jgi:hypothetical protein
MKLQCVWLICLALTGCENIPHPLDCATGLIAWANCPPGTAGYNERQTHVLQEQENDDTRCASYGFSPGTDAFAQCRENLDIDRAHQENANNAALTRSLDQALINSRPPPPPVFAPPPAPVTIQPRSLVNCTTTYSGTMANTLCQ